MSAFNAADADALAELYDDNAVNHQVAEAPVCEKEAIQAFFRAEFAHAKMVCIVENIFEDGQWAIMEWPEPLGLCGCGFFQVANTGTSCHFCASTTCR